MKEAREEVDGWRGGGRRSDEGGGQGEGGMRVECEG